MIAIPPVADVDIDSVAAGGDGVGRVEGLVAFIPRSAPGDRVRARLTPRGRLARGEIEAILRPAAARIEPPCPHYTRDRCGGCQLQHVAYDAQLAAKHRIVTETLARIGKRTVTLPPVIESRRQWRYRRKLTLAMRHVGGRWIAGLHPYDDPDGVFDLTDCPITDERVVATWREIMAAQRFFPRTRRLRGAVRLLEEGASFVLEGGDRWDVSASLLEAAPSLHEIWWAREGAWPRRVAMREGASRGGASFVQVNAAVGDALHDYVVERALSYGARTVVDAYAGTGITAARIAESGASVTAIEVDREAARIAAERLPEGSRAIAARVEDALPGALPAELVLVNPPRSGLDARVAETIERETRGLSTVIYVSCDPATLARDLARMPRWRIASARCFDMFPQTAHVETVCELVPETT